MNTLTLMETFAGVVQAGSFTVAAEQLGLSKSYVSKQVTQLEDELNTRLLYRTTRKLSLTEEGARFYQHCRHIMAEAENARAEIIESHSNPHGKIRITAPQSLIISGIGKVLLKFKQAYPDIDLQIHVSGKFEDLVEEGIDLALRVGLQEDSTLKSRRLMDCEFQVVASPLYINHWGEPNEPADLTKHNCLIYSASKLAHSWPFRLPTGELIMVKVKGNLICDDGNLIVDAVLEGLGIGFGPDFLFKQHLKEDSINLLLSDYYQQPTSITALYPLNRNLPNRVRLLIDFLVKHLSL